MDKIRVIHDPVGKTLTVWWGDPATEAVCEETGDEVVLMKDAAGTVIGCEMLHYQWACNDNKVCTETWCDCRCFSKPIADCCLDAADCDDQDAATSDWCVQHQCVHAGK